MKDINGSYISMLGLKRDIIYDLDGSISSYFDGVIRKSATLVWAYPHIASNLNCNFATYPSLWDGTVLCNSNINIRRVYFTNLISNNLTTNQMINIAPLINL